jgi:hypothetical protein
MTALRIALLIAFSPIIALFTLIALIALAFIPDEDRLLLDAES